MNTNENKKRIYWIIAVVMVITIILIVILIPKGKKEQQTVVNEPLITKAEEDVVKQEETVVEEIIEEETVEESTIENEVQIETYETALDWAMTVDKTTPVMTIWNSITKEGQVLENGQKYFVQEGDYLVLCYNAKERTEINLHFPELEKRYTTNLHREFEFVKIPTEEQLWQIDPIIDGKKYDLSVIITSEEAVSNTSDNSSGLEKTIEVSGFEWARSLVLEEPKLLVWNDETGLKKVIENGERYEIQEGDVIAGCKPSNHMIYDFEPYDFIEERELVSKNIMIAHYILPSSSKEINFIMVTTDENGVEVNFEYTIITP